MARLAKALPFWFMLPAGICVTLFYLIPVVLTFVFSFTTMGSDTGILGNRYVVSDAALAALEQRGLDRELVKRLGQKVYVLDESGLKALKDAGIRTAVLKELAEKLAGRTYTSERALFADLRRLRNRPRSFAERKQIARHAVKTLRNREFTSARAFHTALTELAIEPSKAQLDQILDATNTSWKWTVGNYRELAASQFSGKVLGNTAFYVALTLLFNVGFALVLALMTFYMPQGQAKFFRALWLIPRISPSVIYVLLWKWFTYDSGFLSYTLGSLGVPEQNYLLEYPWTFIVIINGMVGASMGLIIFSSAMHAIPKPLLYASQVDGAYPLQQVVRIVLPQLRWPILFITCYQTMSLLTSFEYILLTTDGGPGFFTTEVWALYAFHSALSNYFGNFRYGYGATLAVVLVVIGIGLSLFYLRFFNFRRLVVNPPIEN
ncbi:MAG: carbohydrate ABC transporter permease [Acidiferrobacterales bacterium]